MDNAVETTKKDETSFGRDVVNLALYYLWRASNWARPYLGGRRGLILLAVAVLGAGAALNWGWLVAIGLAPILLALAPCAAMCALGLCAMKGGGKSCSSGDQSAKERADASELTKPRDDV
jgi:hypothetical protein